MNILQFATNDCWAGGEQMIKNLVQGLNSVGHKTFLVTKKGNNIFLQMFNNLCPIIFLPFKNSLDVISIVRLARFVVKENIDILAVHDKKAAWMAIWAKIITGKGKVVMTWHTVPRKTDRLKRDYIHRFFFRKIDAFICVSELAKQSFVSWNDLVDADKVFKVYNGIDCERWSHGSKTRGRVLLGLEENKRVIGYVGRAYNAPEKRLDVLLKAAALMKNKHNFWQWVIVGDDHDENLKKQITELNLENTVFMYKYIDKIEDVYRALDVFVFTSEKESFGLSLCEAMASQVPVIAAASNLSAAQEIVDNGAGIFFAAGDAEALAEGLEKIINNEKLRLAMVLKAYEKVKNQFSLQKLAKNTEQVYNSLLMERK